MSDPIKDQIINTAFSKLFEQPAAPTAQPVYLQPMQMQQPAPAVGGPVDEIEEVPERELIKVNDDDSDMRYAIDRIPTLIQRSADEVTLVPPASVDAGGYVDDMIRTVNGVIGRGTGAIANAAGVATQGAVRSVASRVQANTNAINAIARQSNTDNRILKGHAAQLRRNSRRTAMLEQAWEARFGEEGQMVRAALQAATALPGLRAADVLSGDAFKGVVAGLKEFSDECADLPGFTAISGTVTKSLGTTYNKAEADAVIAELRQEITDLRNSHNTQMTAIHNALATLVEGEVKKHSEALTTQTAEDTISLLSKLAPSQIVDRGEAMYETILKVVFGKAPGSSFSLSSLLT